MAAPDVSSKRSLTFGGLAPSLEDLPAFEGSERLRPDGRPRRAFRDELRQIPNTYNAVLVLWCVVSPFVVIGAAVQLSHPLGWIAAFALMGIWFQRALTLFHEASHRLLFSNKKWNDLIGEKFIGWIAFGTGESAYRLAHSQHHREEFGPREPDLALYADYPVAKESLRRKLVRDAVGISGWKNLKPSLVGLTKPGRRVRALRFWAGQLVVFACFAALGQPLLYVMLWFLPWMTWWRVANRLRALAEHGGMQHSPDRRLTTHHVQQGWLSRHVFLSQSIGYHLAHHVDSGIPMRNLPKLQRALEEDGYVDESITYPSYRALWRALSR